MSLENIKKSIGEITLGKDCKLCEKYGVTCHDVGLLDMSSGEFNRRTVSIKGRVVFYAEEKINGCGAITGEKTNYQIANVIKRIDKKVNGGLRYTDLEIGNN